MSSDQGEPSLSPEIFQGMITERKMDRKRKAEERRQRDLQRIADMKSTEGIHPLERFPEEMWKTLMEEFGCDDLENLRQVHDVFKDLTEKTKVRDILLPRVLKVGHLNEQLRDEDEFYMNSFKYPPLRLLSKSVRNVMDKFQEDTLLKRLGKMERLPMCLERSRERYEKSFYAVKIYISSDPALEARLDRILSNFSGETPAKRFFTRALVINVVNLNNNRRDARKLSREVFDRFKDKIISLLEIIGNQIWYFSLSASRVEATRVTSPYILFRDCSSLMPNLKWLKYFTHSLSLPYRPFQSLSDQKRLKGKNIAGKNAMESCMRDHQRFPRLEFLELFEFSVCESPYPQFDIFVLETVLRANQRITAVQLGLDKEITESANFHHVSNLINSLDLVGFSPSRNLLLRQVVNFNWKLKVIELGVPDDIPVGSLFELLGRFPTLKNVKLGGLEISEHIECNFLQLPNLKELEIYAKFNRGRYWECLKNLGNASNAHFLLSLQFLLHCKSLKKLVWTFQTWSYFDKLRSYMLRHERHETMINFRAGLRVLYHSNIWDTFPLLDYVKVLLSDGQIGREIYCVSEYHRGDIGEGMSVGGFLKRHKCRLGDQFGRCPLRLGNNLK